jgi:hypothetical protein
MKSRTTRTLQWFDRYRVGRPALCLLLAVVLGGGTLNCSGGSNDKTASNSGGEDSTPTDTNAWAAGHDRLIDANNDGVINILDVSLVASCVGRDLIDTCGCRGADLDHDGEISLDDVEIVQANFGIEGLTIEPEDTTAPTLVVSFPPVGTHFFAPNVVLELATDDTEATIAVDGAFVAIPDDHSNFRSHEIVLVPGLNEISLWASDPSCNEVELVHELFYDTGPNPDINHDGFVDILDVSRVTSCVDQNLESVCSCRIADADGDGRVDLEDVGLVQSHSGESGYPIEVRDVVPPLLTIDVPVAGATIDGATVLVSGTLDDPEATVEINGVPAQIVVGTEIRFSANVPLGFGESSLDVLAIDEACNATSETRNVTRAVQLESIALRPAGLRLIVLPGDQSFEVIATLSDGSTAVISPDQVVFSIDNEFVAQIADDGAITAIANGSALVTAAHAGQSAAAAIVVEVGGSVWSELILTLEPEVLRMLGAQSQVTVSGVVAGEAPRNLTSASSGTVYESSDAFVAQVSSEGLITAVGPGSAVITARNTDQSASANLDVLVSEGDGLLLGQVFDDAQGTPLADATALLLRDGTGDLASPLLSEVDNLGRFSFTAADGAAVVQISAPGYTEVERTGGVLPGLATSLLDARLTPRAASTTLLEPALGGTVVSDAADFTLDVEAGALAAPAALSLTKIHSQGLQGRLPLGWSPLAATDIAPHGIHFGQPALLRVQNDFGLGQDVDEISAARYDEDNHEWIAVAPAIVSADREHVLLSISTSGQFALLLADTTPHAPETSEPGTTLLGTTTAVASEGLTAEGEVAPERRAVGDDLRAEGRVAVFDDPSLPSGFHLVVDVHEEFELLDTHRVVPQPFSQDIVVYSVHPGDEAGLGAVFSVSPSLDFEPGELALGSIHLEVSLPSTDLAGVLIGAAGGVVGPANGDRLEIPSSAVTSESPVDLHRFPAELLPLTLPEGFELLAGFSLDLAGATLAVPATLSIARPPGVGDGAQVLLVKVMTAPDGVGRLRVVGTGSVSLLRITSSLEFGAGSEAALPGITDEGQYLFLTPATPVAFLAGNVLASDGSGAQALALVEAAGSPFADVTGDDGGYRIAAAALSQTRVEARLLLTGDAASGEVPFGSIGSERQQDFVLEAPVPEVIATTPAADSFDIPRSSAVEIDFSRALDPLTLSHESFTLSVAGVPVALRSRLSLDGRTLSLIPEEALESATLYTLGQNTPPSDLSGHVLAAFASISFTTIDTSKAPPPPAGQITASLPDAMGRIEVAGSQGSAEAGSAVTVTNLRTAETFTVQALTDGSFALSIQSEIGDPLSLTFRDSERREVSVALDQLEDPDGRAGIGSRGGVFADAEGRTASLRAGALTQAGVLRLTGARDLSALVALSAGYQYVDSFSLESEGAEFNRISLLTLREEQERLVPVLDFHAPFSGDGQVFVPANFIVGGTLRFSAEGLDLAGNREELVVSVLVLSEAGTAQQAQESEGRFPNLILEAPVEAIPNQEVQVRALAPTARVDFSLPIPAGAPLIEPDAQLLLARVVEIGGIESLIIVDELARSQTEDQLETLGHSLPGAATPGEYAVVLSETPLVYLSGELSGPATRVELVGTPFAVETDGPNAGFQIPVASGEPYELRFVDSESGEEIGTLADTAPPSGTVDLGMPLGESSLQLEVAVQPSDEDVVDIDADLHLRFSEAIDPRTVTATSVLVSDPRGVRVFGSFSFDEDDRVVRFTPDRRWRFGTTYRYGVSTSVLARSGAVLNTNRSGTFTTFAPSLVTNLAFDTVRDIAISGGLGIAAGSQNVSVLSLEQPDAPRVESQIPVADGAGAVEIVLPAGSTDPDTGMIEIPYEILTGQTTPAGIHSLNIDVHLETRSGVEVSNEQVEVTIEVSP